MTSSKDDILNSADKEVNAIQDKFNKRITAELIKERKDRQYLEKKFKGEIQ